MAFDFAGLKQSFFDSEKVIKAVDAGTRKALSRGIVYIWKRAKSSVRYRKKSSEPGMPPSAHRSAGFTKAKKDRKTGTIKRQAASPFRELIFFAYDEQTNSAIAGPAVFESSRVGGGRAPRALEMGGASMKMTARGPRAITVRPHPTMVPAMEAEAPKFAGEFKGVVSE